MRDATVKGGYDKNLHINENRCNNIPIEDNIIKLSRQFLELTKGSHNGKHKPKPQSRDTGKKNKQKRKVKDGLGIKFCNLSINIMGANCRNITNKKASIKEIMEARSVDIEVFSELNTENPPKIKGFTTFSKISKRKFNGIRVYIRNHLRGNVL